MKNLTQGDEISVIIAFALPMLIGNIFQQLYSTVDSLIVGNFVGKEALAAVGISFPVIFLMLGMLMGLTMGTNVLIAQFFGAGFHDKVKKSIINGFIIMVVLSLIITILGLIFTKTILLLLNTPLEILEPAQSYLKITFIGCFTIFGYNTVASILRGLGDSKTPLYLLIVSTIINIFLDLWFVISFKWGVMGVAWATVIAQSVSFVAGLIYIFRKLTWLRFKFTELHIDADIFSKTLQIGIPTGIQQSLVALGMMVMTRIVNGFGTVPIAAFTVASRLDGFASMPALNLSQAMTSFTGQNMGAGKTERVHRGYRASLTIGTIISIAVGIIVMIFSKQLMGFFTPDADVASVGAQYLIVVGATYTLFSTMFINNGVLRGAGDSFIPMINTLLALWVVRIPCAILFSQTLELGILGVWLSVPAGWLMGAVYSTLYYRSGRWKRKALVHHTEQQEAITEA